MDNWREGKHTEEPTLCLTSHQETISHRKLSAVEAHAIWTILNTAIHPHSVQELRIVLKPEGHGGARGWLVCTDS